MLMAYIWTAMALISVLYGAFSGNIGAVSSGMLEGAAAAVELVLSIGGAMCLWSGVMEVMRASGLTSALARLSSPLLRRLFPVGFADVECAGAISENFAANLLGLGNAATPAGIRAVRRLYALGGESFSELSRLVVMNTASFQLLPTTVAAVRAASGAKNAFDILPCVWISSIVSVAVGLLAARAMEERT